MTAAIVLALWFFYRDCPSLAVGILVGAALSNFFKK